MADETLSRDPNRITVNSGVTNDSDLDIVMFRVDPVTKRLLVSTALDKDTDEVLMWLNTAKDGTGTDLVPIVDADGHLQVDVLSGGGAGEQYTDNTVVSAAYKGNLALGTDGSNYQILAVDSSGNLQVDILNASLAVTGTFYQATQPVSAASLPLPTGAATAAKQPALGAAGTPSADVITVQGIADMTALKVDGSAVTQPVSGTFYQATQPVSLASVPSHAVTNAGTFAVQATAVGTIADDATTPGAPVMIGGKAVETDGTDPTSVSAEDDVAIFRTDRNRRLLVNTAHPNLWRASVDYASAQTNASIKTAPGASLSLYITDVIVSNGAVAGNITLLDGSGGTVLLELYPAINGGLTHRFQTPLRLTANTSLNITSTTVTTHAVTVSGFIAP